MISKEKGIELKGLAILIIMIGHLVMLNKTSWNYDMRYFAPFSVSIFLILSGYGLAKSYTANMLNGFFRKRLKSVLWPYFLATMMISVWFGVLFTDPFKAIRSATLTSPNNQIDGTMWFIYFISMWYIVFYITNLLISNISLKIITLLIFAIMINQFPIPYIEPGLAFVFKLHSFSFVFGVFIANVEHLTSKKVIVYASLLSIVLFSCALYFTVTSFTMLSYTLATHLFGLGVIFSYLLFKKKIAILAFFGGISYEMYLFEGALMNIQFSTILTVNAIIFIYITTAIALLFNKLHSNF